MEEDFIYWNHPTPVGIMVEEIFGKTNGNPKLWLVMAYQILCEHGRDSYREIYHFKNGAPFLKGSSQRISITHTNNFLAVAFLPRTPETDLLTFNVRTAMGIDAEPLNRQKVLNVREKFLSPQELTMIPSDDLIANIIAWTSKEAILKASLNSAIDYRNQIILKTLPTLGEKNFTYGKAILIMNNKEEKKEEYEMALYSYESEGNCVTIAYSPQCARFKSKISNF